MPLTSPVDISATTRTPHLATIDDLADRIARLKELAGARAADVDVTIAYNDPSIAQLDRDVERHRDAFAAYEEIGVTWVAVVGPEDVYPRTREFVEGFAERYIGA